VNLVFGLNVRNMSASIIQNTGLITVPFQNWTQIPGSPAKLTAFNVGMYSELRVYRYQYQKRSLEFFRIPLYTTPDYWQFYPTSLATGPKHCVVFVQNTLPNGVSSETMLFWIPLADFPNGSVYTEIQPFFGYDAQFAIAQQGTVFVTQSLQSAVYLLGYLAPEDEPVIVGAQ